MSRRTDGRPKGARLEEGNPRRLADARCAWRGMTPEQRETFRTWTHTDGKVAEDPTTCPECGGQLYYLEDMSARRGAVALSEDNPRVLVIDAFYKTEGFDESATAERLMCGECCYDFEIPEGVEIEWV